MSSAFEARFAQRAHWLARAPGRVNLIGEHTDYNGGLVLPLAIDRETRVHAAANDSRHAIVYSQALNDTTELNLESPLSAAPRGHWTNYLRGVLAGFRSFGAVVPGFRATIESTVPVGSGLSSSASLEAAFATALEALTGRAMGDAAKIELCRRAEIDYAGVPCGIMDQSIVVSGRRGQLLLLDCGSGVKEWVAFDDPAIVALVIDTRVRHSLASGEYARRRAECEQVAAALNVMELCRASLEQLQAARDDLRPVLYRRARHVLTEQLRTRAAADAVRRRDWPAMGMLMYASHASLRDDFEVSCAELDAVVEVARQLGSAAGIHGCRMTGGGFGGCAVALVRQSRAAEVAERLAADVRERVAIEPVIFATRAAQGATLQALPH